MHCQVVHPSEALAAVRALVRSLTRVDADVQLQVAPLCEAPAAMRAFVWPLTRVHPNMSCQIAPVCEALVAMATPKRTLSGVLPLVDLKFPAISCGIATLRAQELLSSSLRFLLTQ